MNRDGFTLVEMIIGMLIFAVGVLGLVGSTAFVSLQINAADMRTERSMARQQVVEELRTTDFDAVQTVAKASGTAVGDYTIWWDVSELDWALKQVTLYTEGPAFRDSRRTPAVVDTVNVRIARLLE